MWRLQDQINMLQKFHQISRMQVHVDKTKVKVSRNKGILKSNEKLFLVTTYRSCVILQILWYVLLIKTELIVS